MICNSEELGKSRDPGDITSEVATVNGSTSTVMKRNIASVSDDTVFVVVTPLIPQNMFQAVRFLVCQHSFR